MSEVIEQTVNEVEPIESEVEQTEEQDEQPELTPEEQEAKADADKHRKGVQERINKSVGKQREAERQRDAAIAELNEMKARVNPIVEPNIEDFETLEDYQKAERKYGAELAKQEFQKGQSQNTQQTEIQSQLQAYQTREAELATTISDYKDVIAVADQIIGEAGLPTEVSLALIKNPNGARIGYEICKDTDQLIEFLGMSPSEQLMRIGEVNATLPKASAKTPTSANLPKPITPVSGNATANKDVKRMSTAEFIAHRNKTANRR